MVDLLVNPPLTLYFVTEKLVAMAKLGWQWNDGMSFFRMVDLLVNPPLTLYFVNEKQEVTKNLGWQWNDGTSFFRMVDLLVNPKPGSGGRRSAFFCSGF